MAGYSFSAILYRKIELIMLSLFHVQGWTDAEKTQCRVNAKRNIYWLLEET